MNANSRLLRAVRAGDLAAAQAALDAGADANAVDGCGDAGLPLRLAAYHGDCALVRELVGRGAEVNPSPRLRSNRPIVAAAHNGQTATVRLLLELGADLPDGLKTGLDAADIAAAQTTARAAAGLPHDAQVEEIELHGCYGVDTFVLDADLLRLTGANAEAVHHDAPASAAEETNVVRFRFWQRKRA